METAKATLMLTSLCRSGLREGDEPQRQHSSAANVELRTPFSILVHHSFLSLIDLAEIKPSYSPFSIFHFSSAKAPFIPGNQAFIICPLAII
jgi:hypothetical protein